MNKQLQINNFIKYFKGKLKQNYKVIHKNVKNPAHNNVNSLKYIPDNKK